MISHYIFQNHQSLIISRD